MVGLYVLLFGVNVAVWAWALIAFRDYPLLLGTALLAYRLRPAPCGRRRPYRRHRQRHAQADAGRQAAGRGRLFLLARPFDRGGAGVARDRGDGGGAARRFDAFKDIGALIGTGVSALFLFAIAAANLLVLRAVWRSFRRVRRGEPLADDDLDMLLADAASCARLFRPLFRLIGASWHMYPLGFLFGLGFDTATEIGLLGISAAEAAKGLSLWSILVFPALFTAGMALVDTSDGMLMLGAYGWAFRKPLRKLHYNITITARLGGGGAARRRRRGAGPDRRPARPRRRVLARDRRAQRQFRQRSATPSSRLFALSWLVSAALYRRATKVVSSSAANRIVSTAIMPCGFHKSIATPPRIGPINAPSP